MSLRALVTGATGFVGRALCPYLEGLGWQVVRVGAAGEAAPSCDISDSGDATRLIAGEAPFTHLFHLAAVAHLPQALEHPARAFEVNTIGTVNLVTAMTKYAPSARFINIGSGAQYGRNDAIPYTEETPLAPDTPYSISKTAAEQFCRYAHASSGFDCVMLRPFNHSGPGQPPGFVLPSFAKQIAAIAAGKAAPVIEVGNLEAARDFLHIDDVVRAYAAAADRGHGGQVYNIASGTAYSIRALLDRMIELSGVEVRVHVDPARLRPVDVPRIAGDASKIAEDCGWRPEKTIDDLLRDLLAYWREQV